MKIKVSPAMLTRINNSKKFGNVVSGSNQLVAGINAARTASRGGIGQSLGQGLANGVDSYRFYGLNQDKLDEKSLFSPPLINGKSSVFADSGAGQNISQQ